MNRKARHIQVERPDGKIEEYAGFNEWHVFSQGIILEFDNRHTIIPYVNARDIVIFDDNGGHSLKEAEKDAQRA